MSSPIHIRNNNCIFLSPTELVGRGCHHVRGRALDEDEDNLYSHQHEVSSFFILNNLQTSIYIMQQLNTSYSLHFSPIIDHSFIGNSNESILTTSRKHSSFHTIFYSPISFLKKKGLTGNDTYSKKNIQYIHLLISSYLYLLNTIHILQSQLHFIHSNITENSIVFTDSSHPLLSDFSLSFNFINSNLTEERKRDLFSATDFEGYPFSKFVLCYLQSASSTYRHKSSLSSANVLDICSLFIDKYIGLSASIFSSSQLETYKNNCIFSLTPFINKPISSLCEEFIHKKSLSWDIHNTSVIYLKLLHTLFSGIHNSFVSAFTQLLIESIISFESDIDLIRDKFCNILYTTEFEMFIHTATSLID